MIKIRLKDYLEEQERSLYWLAQKTGIRYATLLQIYHNRLQRLNLNYLCVIMTALDIDDMNVILEKVEEDI